MAHAATLRPAMPGKPRPLTTHYPLQQAAVYAMAGLIGLAIMPVLFVALDHAVVVQWSNTILDLLTVQ